MNVKKTEQTSNLKLRKKSLLLTEKNAKTGGTYKCYYKASFLLHHNPTY